jgi:endonuclease YncB( thermonuclease family)
MKPTRRHPFRASRAMLVVLAVMALGSTAGPRTAQPVGARELQGRNFDARVIRVADGDSVEAIPSGQSRPVRMRLQGIDSPEQGEVFSRPAADFLRTRVLQQMVRVRGREVDRYGRLVVRLIRGGVDMSVELVRAGLACHAYAYDAALAHEEAQARAGGHGFWAAGARKPACVRRTAFSARTVSGKPISPGQPANAGRAGSSSTAPGAPGSGNQQARRGNVSSKLYHAPWCPNYNCRNCTRLFASEAEARLAGFTPSRDCHTP